MTNGGLPVSGRKLSPTGLRPCSSSRPGESQVSGIYRRTGLVLIMLQYNATRKDTTSTYSSQTDWKSALNNECQARGFKPSYATRQVGGSAHNPQFQATVEIDGCFHTGDRSGRRLDSEQLAAWTALQSLPWVREANPGRDTAIKLLEAAAAAAFALDPDLSGQIKEGSFNPYGNGQWNASFASPTIGGAGSVRSSFWTLYTASAAETVSGTLVCSFSGANSRCLGGVQIVPSAGSPLNVEIPYDGDFIPSAYVDTTGRVVLAMNANEVNTASIAVPFVRTLATGDSIVMSTSKPPPPTGSPPGGTFAVTITTEVATAPGGGGGGGGGVSEVNVVGIAELDRPLWTTSVNPRQTVMDPPVSLSLFADPDLSGAVKQGSFNPYGNGQPDFSDGPSGSGRDRVNWEKTITADNIEGHLKDGAGELPVASSKWALEQIDPDIYSYTATFEPFKDQEVRDAAVSREITAKQVTTPRASGGRTSPSETVSKDKATASPAKKATSTGPLDDRKNLDATKQLRSVAARVAAKAKSWGDVLDWLAGGDPVPDYLARAVMNAYSMKAGSDDSADKWVVQGYAVSRPSKDTFEGLAYWSPSLQKLQGCAAYHEWMKTRYSDYKSRVIPVESSPSCAVDSLKAFGIDGSRQEVIMVLPTPVVRQLSVATPHREKEPHDVDDSDKIKLGFNPYGNGQHINRSGADEALALAWNKLMHSANGNTMDSGANWNFPNSMEEVMKATSLRPLFESEGSPTGPLLDPVVEVEMQTGLRGPQGVTMSMVPRETALRGATISTNNVVTQLNDLNSPEALLYPLTVRNGAGAALIDATRRPQLFGVGTVRRTALAPAVESSEGMSLRELISRTGNIRADQITINGFKTSDVAALLRLQPEMNGDSMASLYLKLNLYEMSRSWLQDPVLLPLGGEPGKFDSYTQLDVDPGVDLGFNDATVFGADCGGTEAPVFPYEDAAFDSTIAFHVCRASIPNNEPFFMINPALLLQNDRGEDSLNIALLALALAPYPCGIHTVTVETLDSAGGNAAQQEFMPLSDAVHMPGERTLHFYLPNTSPAAPPNTAQEARATALVIPKAGPTAAGALAANQNLTYSSVGNLVTYSLPAYLTSWMALPNSPIDQTTLTRFRKQLAESVSRAEDLRYCYELACSLAVRYPVMVESVPGTPTRFAAGSEASVAHQNFFALQPHAMTADYPQRQDLYDSYVPSLNPSWWNKIMSGAYISTPDGAIYPPQNFAYDGSPRLAQYAIHTIRDYAATSEYVFQYFMQSREVWNSAFTQLNFVAVLDQIRAVFTDAQRSSASGQIVSDLGDALATLHSRVNGYRPAPDMYGHTIWDYINVPRVGFQGVYSTAGAVLNTPIPCVLADIWIQMESRHHIMAFTPMLSTNKQLTGVHLADGQVTALGGGGYTVPIPIDTQARSVGLDTLPLLDDRVVFNSRLVWHTFPASLYTLDGNIYAVSTVASGRVVSQKAVTADWTLTNLLSSGILTAKTAWFPFMNLLGLRLAVGVSQANNAALMTQIMAAKTTTGVACWLIRNAMAMPNVIVDGGGANRVSRLPRRRRQENSLPSSETASEAGPKEGSSTE